MQSIQRYYAIYAKDTVQSTQSMQRIQCNLYKDTMQSMQRIQCNLYKDTMQRIQCNLCKGYSAIYAIYAKDTMQRIQCNLRKDTVQSTQRIQCKGYSAIYTIYAKDTVLSTQRYSAIYAKIQCFIPYTQKIIKLNYQARYGSSTLYIHTIITSRL